jgi:hypothetical protein
MSKPSGSMPSEKFAIFFLVTLSAWSRYRVGLPNEKYHLDSCHIRYRMSPTILYVWMYDIICPVLDVVYYIVYTISYIRYSFHGHTILDVRYRMFIRYRMSTCDIVCMIYDIVPHNEIISYTISSVMYDIVCAYRIQYRMSCKISYVYLRYRMLTYDIVCKFGHLSYVGYDIVLLYTMSYVIHMTLYVCFEGTFNWL